MKYTYFINLKYPKLFGITKMNVPFLDLNKQYQSIKQEIDTAIQNVLDDSAFVLGKYVEEFEKNFAQYIGVKHAIAVNSGTAALHISLLALGIGKGDEVITTSNTFFATAEAVSLVGAIPVFVDINERTYNMDPQKLKAAITDKTKAVIPVHLYGQPADIDEIKEICEQNNLHMIEDACQAVAAEYKGKKVGSFGITGCFSFYPGKNLGAYGEGGIITTDDSKIAELSRLYRAHGESPKFYHKVIGLNYRMPGMQGAILNVKLKHIDEWTRLRQKNAAYFSKILKEKGIKPPVLADDRTHVFHLFVIRHPKRDELRKYLAENQIHSGIHYKIPLHLQEAYSGLGYKKGDFPVTEKAMDEIISLPMFPELTEEQMDYAASKLDSFS